MTPDYKSVALPLLVATPNRAMDAALVETITHTTGPARVDLLDALLARAHAPSLAALVACFGSGSAVLDQLLVRRVRGLESGLRIASLAESPAMRASAIALIVEANDPGVAYILAQAMSHPDEPTRHAAGDALHVLTTRFVQGRALDCAEPGAVPFDQQDKQLGAALGHAVLRWEQHTHRSCLASAMWMGLSVRDDIARALDKPRNTLRVPMERMLDRTNDPRLAAFVVTALSIPQLRNVAARTLSMTRDAQFIDAVVRQASLLRDDAVRRGCRWVKKIEWLASGIEKLLCGGDSELTGVIDFLSACGAPAREKLRLYRRLIDEGVPSVRRAALSALEQDLGRAARGVLTSLAIRSGDDLAPRARDLLRERADGAEAGVAVSGRRGDIVDAYFNGEAPLGDADALAMRRSLACLPGGALVALRARLASLDALDKARALHVAHAAGLIPELAPQVHRLVHDADATVRSVAVAMLTSCPSPTAQRLARAALDDADDRVRASAVEAMEAMDVANRGTCTLPLLSDRNQRLRANAVKSLLMLSDERAGESLLDMLNDPSPAHRISALWVADRLRLRSVVPRVQKMAMRDRDDRVQHRARCVLERLAGQAGPHATVARTVPVAHGGAL